MSADQRSKTCQSLMGGDDAPRCAEPAAYVDRNHNGWCLRHGAEIVRRFGASGMSPTTPLAKQFLAEFEANGYGPVGHVWPDAPETDERDDAENTEER